MTALDLSDADLLAGIRAVYCDETPDAVTAAARAVYTQHRLEVLLAAACPVPDVADDGLLLAHPLFPLPETGAAS